MKKHADVRELTFRDFGFRTGTIRFFLKRNLMTPLDFTLYTKAELFDKGIVNRLLEYVQRQLHSYGLTFKGEDLPKHGQRKEKPDPFNIPAPFFLREKGVHSIGELADHTDDELVAKGVHRKHLYLVHRKLQEYELEQKTKPVDAPVAVVVTRTTTPIAPKPQAKQQAEGGMHQTQVQISKMGHAAEVKVRKNARKVYAPKDMPLEHAGFPKHKIPFFQALGFRVLGDFTVCTVHELIEKGIVKQALSGVHRQLSKHGLTLRVDDKKPDPEKILLKNAGFSPKVTKFYAERGVKTLGELAKHTIDHRHLTYVQTRLARYDLAMGVQIEDEDEEEVEEDELNELQFPAVMPDGTRSSAGEYLKRNERLIYSFIHRSGVLGMMKTIPNRTFDIQDLYQEARIGFLIALSRFDPQKGKISTYAWMWMYQRVTRFIKDNSGAVRIPINLRDACAAYLAKENELRTKTGEAPTHAEVMKALNVPASKLRFILQALSVYRSKSVSMHQPLRTNGQKDNSSAYQDVIGDETLGSGKHVDTPAEVFAIRRELDQLLADVKLKPKDREILARRYGLGGRPAETLEEIGETLGLTRERVRQREEAALRKIRLG